MQFFFSWRISESAIFGRWFDSLQRILNPTGRIWSSGGPFILSTVNAHWHLRCARFGGPTSQRHGANAMRKRLGERPAASLDF
jgi:hypothetical protein